MAECATLLGSVAHTNVFDGIDEASIARQNAAKWQAAINRDFAIAVRENFDLAREMAIQGNRRLHQIVATRLLYGDLTHLLNLAIDTGNWPAPDSGPTESEVLRFGRAKLAELVESGGFFTGPLDEEKAWMEEHFRMKDEVEPLPPRKRRRGQ